MATFDSVEANWLEPDDPPPACHQCYGECKVDCVECEGKGCETCEGTGLVTCFRCDGTGEEPYDDLD
jgi:hypothetical protein